MSAAVLAAGGARYRSLQALNVQWRRLAPRERALVLLAAAVVGLGVLWGVLLAPAWRTLRAAPAQRQVLDAQLDQMRGLQAQALALQKQPAIGTADSQRQLEALATELLGPGSLSVQGGTASVTLRNVPAQQLAAWLNRARTQAHALPQQARLEHSAAGWNGSLLMRLPAPVEGRP